MHEVEEYIDYNYLINNKKTNIFLEKDGELLKFKVSIPSIDFANEFKSYLYNPEFNELKILREKDVKFLGFPLKLVRNLGKFRLHGNILKTNNYLVPNPTSLSNYLSKKYSDNKNNIKFFSDDLCKLYDLKQHCEEHENKIESGFIENLIGQFQVELQRKYNPDSEELKLYIQNLIEDKDDKLVLLRLKEILLECTRNKMYIEKLGIEDKFIKAIEEKDKQTEYFEEKVKGLILK